MNKRKISSIVSLLSIFSLLMLAVGPLVTAATTAGVTATVTVQNISVSVADGTVTYGTLSTSATANTTASGLNDSQTATNDGNITEDFSIIGVDSAAWELADTAGSNNYTHKYCVSDCDGSPVWVTFNEDSYTEFADSVSSTGNQVFDLQIGTPTSSSSYTVQTVSVTVQAATHS